MKCRMLLKLILFCFVCVTQAVSAAENISNNAVLRMGFYYPSVSQIASRSDILVSLTYWTQELSHRFEMQVVPVQLYDDIEFMAKAFEKGDINLAVAPPMSVAIHFDRNSLAECLMATRANDKLDATLLVTRLKLDRNAIGELRGKHILMPHNDELAEIFLNLLTLKEANIPYSKFFAKVTFGDTAKRMLLDVFFDKAEAAIVNQATYELMLELNPQLGEKIRIVADLPQKSRNYGFVQRDYIFHKRVAENYLKIADTLRGQQLLAVYQQEKMVFCDNKDLNSFDALYAEYRNLQKLE